MPHHRVPWWAWGLLAASTLPFANGRFSFWVAPWLAFTGLIAFTRTAPARAAVGGSVLLLAGGAAVHSLGVLPFRGAAYVAAAIVIGLAAVPPFLLDRVTIRRLPPLAGSLVLPCTWVAIEWAAGRFGPYGTWGALGYTQRDRLALVQMVSVTGVHGLSFLLMWVASAGAMLLAALPERRVKPAMAAGLVLVLTVSAGAIRLARAPRADDGVPVALVTPRIQTYLGKTTGVNAPLGVALLASSRRQALNDDARKAFRDRSESLATELLLRTQRAAVQGARIVLWSEAALIVAPEDETAFVERAGILARDHGLHLAVSFLRLSVDGSGRIENLTILLSPSGKPLWRFLKAHPVPGLERCVAGDGLLPMAGTPVGRLTTAICFDADFPAFLRQAAGADLLLIPADDWKEISRVHSAMAAFRAVELGVPIARSASAGVSAVVDAYGREISTLGYFGTEERTLLARIPVGSVGTIYGRAGDALPVLCAGSGVVLLLFALLGGAKPTRILGESRASLG
jgi:apolipoprotein N-acyltransferase